MIKYVNIHRMKKNYVNGFSTEDEIVIEEKVAGSNFSIRVEDGEVTVYNRNYKLSEEYGMRGCRPWVYSQNLGSIKKVLGTDLILYGEWVTPHTVEYPTNYVPYFYDVYSISSNSYLNWKDAKDIVDTLGFDFVPVLYSGKFISWEQVYKLIGETKLGAEKGEGIIVKNMSRLKDNNHKFPYFVKLVTEDFAEAKNTEGMDLTGIDNRVKNQVLVDTIVTSNRIDKLIRKMEDDNEISGDYTEDDKKRVYKLIGTAVYRDCLKEEPEIVNQLGKSFMSYAIVTAKKLVESSSLFSKKG